MNNDIPELDKEYVLSNALPAMGNFGVYFLVDGDEIVYIGQSKNILLRLRQHKQEARKFDRVFILDCDKSELDNIEAKYVLKFSPPLNKQKSQRIYTVHLIPQILDDNNLITGEEFSIIENAYKAALGQRRNTILHQMSAMSMTEIAKYWKLHLSRITRILKPQKKEGESE